MRAILSVLALVVLVVLGVWRSSSMPRPDRFRSTAIAPVWRSVIDQYLAAVVAHDPKRVPLSADVKYTENNQVIEVGDGFWKTAQGVGNYKHYFADPEFGQVAFMGTMMEAGAPLLFSLRLRIELGRITEIETILLQARAAADRTTSRRWTSRARPKTSGSSRSRRRSGCRARR